MAELIIQTGRHQGKKIVLPDDSAVEVVIGRDEDCQIRLGARDVSRRHCALRSSGEGIVVRDLGSQNGTFVNDRALTGETTLHPGDLLRIGPMVLQAPRVFPPELAGAARAERRGGLTAAPARRETTDEDIVSWLADDDTGADPGDTTIIPDRESKRPAGMLQPAEPPRKKKKYKSLAEEAAEIIQRHLDSGGLEKAPAVKNPQIEALAASGQST